MAGVGKTNIMKYVHDQLLHLGVFKSIICLIVSEALDLLRSQCDIADAIWLALSNRYDKEENIKKI